MKMCFRMPTDVVYNDPLFYCKNQSQVDIDSNDQREIQH